MLTEDMIDTLPGAGEYLLGSKRSENVSLTLLGVVDEIKQKDISNTTAVLFIDDTLETSVDHWAGALRLFNLFQFLNYAFFTTASGLEENAYDLLLLNPGGDQRKGLDAWGVVYEEVLDEAKSLVRLLSQESFPLPEVGYELCDEQGRVIAESELAWPDRKIAVMLEEIPVPDERNREGWDIYSVKDEKAIIERIKQKDNR